MTSTAYVQVYTKTLYPKEIVSNTLIGLLIRNHKFRTGSKTFINPVKIFNVFLQVKINTFLRKPWRDIFTYYLSLITYYLLLITYYLLLITYYLPLITYYLLLITYHIIYHPYNGGKLQIYIPCNSRSCSSSSSSSCSSSIFVVDVAVFAVIVVVVVVVVYV